MRKMFVRLTLAALAWGCAAAVVSQMPTGRAASLEWRFAGLNAVRENKDLVTWREVTGLPQFTGLNSNLVQRVAISLAKALAKDGGNQTNLTAALKPIAEDLVAYPTIYELNEAGGANTWTLAIQIPATHQDIWKTSWDRVAQNGKTDGTKLSRDGNWTVLGNGPTKGVLEKAKQPTSDVLQISGDAMLLKKIAPQLKPAHSELKVAVRGKGLRSEGKIKFEEDLPFKLTRWEIPTNTIREPLIGFTAIQGVQDYLAKMDAFKKHPASNQIFIWNERVSPFSVYAAFKVDDAKSFVHDFALGLNPQDIGKKVAGNLEFDTNTFGLFLTGLPIAVPFLRPAHSNDVNFVQTGALPMTAWLEKPMPGELAAEVTTRTNLLYYDWELGGERMTQIRPLSQMAMIAQKKMPSSFNDPANKWLSAAESKFGNTITEISRTGPRELSIVRSSDTGLSAIEIFAFVQWVAGPPAELKHAPKTLPAPPAVKP